MLAYKLKSKNIFVNVLCFGISPVEIVKTIALDFYSMKAHKMYNKCSEVLNFYMIVYIAMAQN